MTEAELVTRGKKLYERILDVPFSPDEMLAFGRAVFTKTPWGALTPVGKVAIFRLAAAIAALDGPEVPPADAGPAASDATVANQSEEAPAAPQRPESGRPDDGVDANENDDPSDRGGNAAA
jgi:hypothetical protein